MILNHICDFNYKITMSNIHTGHLWFCSARLGEGGGLVVLLFYVHGKHLRSCRDGQLT